MLISIRVLIVGGTEIKLSQDDVFPPLDSLAEDYGSRVPSVVASVKLTIIHQGRGSGLDGLAEEWAKAHGMSVWELRLPRRDSLKDRSLLLLEEGKPDVVLAFPGGRSVLDVVVRAQQREIPVIIVPALSQELKNSVHGMERGKTPRR